MIRLGIHPSLFPGKGAQYTRKLVIIALTNPVICFLCNDGVNSGGITHGAHHLLSSGKDAL